MKVDVTITCEGCGAKWDEIYSSLDRLMIVVEHDMEEDGWVNKTGAYYCPDCAEEDN
ncbi:MAG: hypothetical protein ACLFWB_08385 [Armatimonadota bacterium]